MDGLGVALVTSLAADSGGVWVTFRPGNGFTGEPSDVAGVHRFDGTVWTTHLGDHDVTSVAAAPDGTVWAATGTGPVRVAGETSGSDA